MNKENEHVLLPWHKTIINMAMQEDGDNIHFIINLLNTENTIPLISFIEKNKMGKAIPSFQHFKDVMNFVITCPEQKAYFIDLPRYLRRDEEASFCDAIANIKNGYVWDNRYCFKDKYFSHPNVFVFAYMIPKSALFRDYQCIYWYISEYDELTRLYII